jgi:hypothetical protein
MGLGQYNDAYLHPFTPGFAHIHTYLVYTNLHPPTGVRIPTDAQEYCTMRVFGQKFALEHAFGSHACSLEARAGE